jgi:cholinesterase
VASRPVNASSVAFANVTATGIKILQIQSENDDTFSEDCLTLNVWTKPQTGKSAKAVIVFIHGGAFSTGAISNPFEDGSKFADEQDVVVVSMK